jgi:hypothetical protein
MNMTFSKLARVASATDDTIAIVNKHIRAAATEIAHLNKSRKKKPAAGPSNSAHVEPTKPRDPPKTTTKGRTKSKRTKSALSCNQKGRQSAMDVGQLTTTPHHAEGGYCSTSLTIAAPFFGSCNIYVH